MAAFTLASLGASQSYLLNEVDIPFLSPHNTSYSETVDFGDVDLDGDFDALFADGGDCCDDQNRIWINSGGLQLGTVGQFVDETAARLPALLDDSRDVDFVDFDGDADLDYFTCNTSDRTDQGNRWATNQGGAQGGALGFFVDETAARWVGLGSAGSSIPNSLLLPNSVSPETFLDWSHDAEFVDFDNDGDLDLFQSSTGSSLGGTTPSRVFLNDGLGFFEEFNPSGHKLVVASMPNGAPGLWCEGVQQHETTNVDGTQCDIAASCAEVDVADVDGDLDLDVLLGSIFEEPRFFQNRLAEDGALAFRDVSGTAFTFGINTGNGGFDQEFADLDNDGDLDLHALNWGSLSSSLSDWILENDGTGVFTASFQMPSSGVDDNEGDFVDFDNDGDLDYFVAAWDNQDQLYRNDTAEALQFVQVTGTEVQPVATTVSMDVGIADVDNDGDYDYFVANNSGQRNRYFENFSDVADTHAPSLAQLEGLSDSTASAVPRAVRVYVEDNTPAYLTYFNETELELAVDGIPVPGAPMRSSGGQVFRGELPGNLVGVVTYSATSTDAMGNVGTSGIQQFTGVGPALVSQGQTSPSTVGIPILRELTAPITEAPLYLVGENVAPGTLGLFLFSLTNIPGGLDLGFGAILNVNFPLLTDPILATADGAGSMLCLLGNVPPAFSGVTAHAQALFFDGVVPGTWASSQSLALPFP